MSKKLYMVETVSLFRMRYVVEAKDPVHATDEVVMRMGDTEIKEFSQHHIDECISSVRELTRDEYIKEFDTDNDYLKSWTDSQKFSYVNVIDYGEEDGDQKNEEKI
jgi:hypothetical protein